jgi:serine/threonine protein kinase
MTECEIDQSVAAQNTGEIKQSDLVFEEKLASGKSGDIWKGVLKETKQVAIQVIIEKDEEWIQAMLKLNNPNILGIEAVCYTQQEALIVTELMENDNLVKFLRGGGRSLKMQQLMHIAVQVSQGMVYLKNQQVVHRDLCARNVLVGDKMLCKITGILGDWADEVDDPYYEGRLYSSSQVGST